MLNFVNHALLTVTVAVLMPISGAIAQNAGTVNSQINAQIKSSHWAQVFMQGLIQRNLISQPQSLQPDQKVTRAEFAITLDRAFPFQPAIRQAIAFNDVPSTFWAADAIQSIYAKGFWSSDDIQFFRPEGYMTRWEAMVAIANGLSLNAALNSKVNSKKVDPKVFLFSIYTDAASIPAGAIASIAALTDKQIIVNYPNVRQLNPNAVITRAELAALVYQSLVYMGQLDRVSSNFIASRNNPLFNATDFTAKEIITHLRVNLRRREVVVYQGDKKLKTYPLGVGRAGWDTPSGSYQVKQIIRSPDWKNPFTGDVIKANDPDNPLGGYWIGFWTNGKDWSGFHGTSQRDSVGKASSHGCLRMYKEDIKAIFDKVTLATVVEIIR
ncbi:hypothetical protein Syn7502_01818 [Synechococcus sp. PCC 7502]|uniref:L,D-transpeptidase family protein n=1 Tax=Synechococcus sp. PCC 7502 TaxID=1173263 RepID=UPI00029FCC30|nr:L,D-transpeptidase family protein [Synechococcus sp. PCC 7502]AFY73858.1 hypothetical protein Syn7502_01818 [Synechococcus sp. PCC 7502]